MDYADTERGRDLIQKIAKENTPEYTLCDMCSQQTDIEDCDTPETGEWEGATLCPDCMAEAQEE